MSKLSRLAKISVQAGKDICLGWQRYLSRFAKIFVQVGKVLNRGATADERRQGAILRRY